MKARFPQPSINTQQNLWTKQELWIPHLIKIASSLDYLHVFSSFGTHIFQRAVAHLGNLRQEFANSSFVAGYVTG
ncbi:MAG: hypothetical protein A2522_08725 [Gallionellales bacterium RIFOXYD12_FULL_53_10]|nr:MAG: hypothetical protein A2Z87_00200 [Gallionellales bacterium GWA2_54_124]OGT17936.1 MAG: hypothetical protein A2522_08725 [Gallionellales bacterium RIFOXYD12_FULL_53_10]OGT22640.1 MAG: hypothetical protein A3K00_01590 [Gallionellales bacterium RIFOXYD2_FULL_52_7]